MTDELFIGAADMADLVGYLGQAFALGLGVGICLFFLGYAVWFVMDLVRGGI